MTIETYETEVRNIIDEIRELNECIKESEEELATTEDVDYMEYLEELLGDQYRRHEKLVVSLELYRQYS